MTSPLIAIHELQKLHYEANAHDKLDVPSESSMMCPYPCGVHGWFWSLKCIAKSILQKVWKIQLSSPNPLLLHARRVSMKDATNVSDNAQSDVVILRTPANGSNNKRKHVPNSGKPEVSKKAKKQRTK